MQLLTHAREGDIDGCAALMALPFVDVNDTRHGRVLFIETSMIYDACDAHKQRDPIALPRFLLSQKAALSATDKHELMAAEALVIASSQAFTCCFSFCWRPS